MNKEGGNDIMQHIKFPKIFRACIALVLALILMLGTMTTGLAAAVDELAETESANIQRILFVGIPTDWGTNVSNTSIQYYTAGDSSTTGLTLTSAGVTSGDGNNNMFYATVTTTKNNWQIVRDGNWYGGDQDITSKNVGYIWWDNGAQASYTTFQMTSTAQLKIDGQNSASIIAGGSVTVTPSLTSNTTFNDMKSHSYAVKKNGTSVTASSYISNSTGVFSTSQAGSYEITDTVTYNAKGFTNVTKTATTNTVRITVVEAAAASWAVKSGMSFYLDDRNSLGTPKFYFATSSSGTGATSAITGSTITGNSNIYFANAPADGYTYIKITNSAGTISSGWCPITSAATNTMTYKDGQFYGLQLPITNEHSGVSTFSGTNGHIYFDNTLSNWTIDSTNKLYLVVGRDNYQKMYQMSKVTNTSQLYYVKSSDNWGSGADGYTYIGFAVATTAKNGAYGPNTASNGVLKVASKYTNLVSM